MQNRFLNLQKTRISLPKFTHCLVTHCQISHNIASNSISPPNVRCVRLFCFLKYKHMYTFKHVCRVQTQVKTQRVRICFSSWKVPRQYQQFKFRCSLLVLFWCYPQIIRFLIIQVTYHYGILVTVMYFTKCYHSKTEQQKLHWHTEKS